MDLFRVGLIAHSYACAGPNCGQCGHDIEDKQFERNMITIALKVLTTPCERES